MNAPDPQVGFSPGVGNPNVDPQHGPRRCQKKKEAGHQKMPIAHTYSVASKKKIFRLTMIAQRDQLLRWVVSRGKKKRMNGAMRPSRCFPQMAFMQLPRSSHLGINYRPFWPALQATYKQHPTSAILATLGRFAMAHGSFCIVARLEQLPNHACELNSLPSTIGKPWTPGVSPRHFAEHA